MLRLPEFNHREAETAREAAELLDEYGRDAMLVAGGTDVLPKMKRRQFTPDVLVSLASVDEMIGIEEKGDGLRIGGQESLATIAASEVVRERYPAVAKAAEEVSTPTLRKMGTLAGNLCQDTRCVYYDRTRDWREGVGWCMKAPGPDGKSLEGADDGDAGVPCRVAPGSNRCWAVFASDTAPALIAHGAEVELVGRDGDRVIPLIDLYRDDGIDHLDMRHDELVTAVRLPASDRIDSTYRKFSRRDAFDFADVGVATTVRQAADGRVENARIVLTGVDSRPVEATEAAEQLEGEQPTTELLEAVGETTSRAVRPLDNTDAHPGQRNRIAATYTERALAAVTSLKSSPND